MKMNRYLEDRTTIQQVSKGKANEQEVSTKSAGQQNYLQKIRRDSFRQRGARNIIQE